MPENTQEWASNGQVYTLVYTYFCSDDCKCLR